MKRQAATLQDVAKAAGVGKSVASAVLNGADPRSRVSETTRQRIKSAAQELRYSPNAAARGLRRAKLDTIGVSLHALGRLAISNPYGNQVLLGIVQAANDAKYNVTHVQKPWNETDGSIEGFRSDLVDGMVVVAPGVEYGMIADLAKRGVPVVAVSVPGEACGVPSVDVDNIRGTHLIMEHLLGLGHERIAHLTWTRTRPDTIERRATFLAIMADAGLHMPPEYIQEEDADGVHAYGDYSIISVPLESETPFEFYNPARRLLTMPNGPTAIFACDDRVARDVLHAARDLGISVPHQLSVVGFDDIPDAARFNPPLTTVRQPLAEMGAEAARLLLAIIAGEESVPKTHWFEPKLIIRQSSGPAL